MTANVFNRVHGEIACIQPLINTCTYAVTFSNMPADCYDPVEFKHNRFRTNTSNQRIELQTHPRMYTDFVTDQSLVPFRHLNLNSALKLLSASIKVCSYMHMLLYVLAFLFTKERLYIHVCLY